MAKNSLKIALQGMLFRDIMKILTGGETMRIMAVDLGDARTGLAVSDMLGMLCGEA